MGTPKNWPLIGIASPVYPLVIAKRGTELFRIEACGDIYVRGVLTHDDAAIVRGLRASLKGLEARK